MVNNIFNADALIRDYNHKPVAVPVTFGTSGHRGSSNSGSFQEAHALAIAQAICDYRRSLGISGPLYLGKDTHLISAEAEKSLLEVLVGNGVAVILQCGRGFCPTPVISFSILNANRQGAKSLSDGIVVTPSHNPPEDAGIKYNPPHAGPAESAVTTWIEKRANQILDTALSDVKRSSNWQTSELVSYRDLIDVYVDALSLVIDLQAIKRAKLKIAVDPLGGAGLEVWERICDRFGLGIEILDRTIDASFSFMPRDHDKRIRMDCSSAAVMSAFVARVPGYSFGCANDPDADRHGIVDPEIGLLNPNFFIALSIDYLLRSRGAWSKQAKVGKTIVSSTLIDRVVAKHARQLFEVPVGFKWFAEGLHNGQVCFGGEESAGASFLRFDGGAWSTDKDGIIMALLAAEMIAVEQLSLKELQCRLFGQFFTPHYRRVDQALSPELRTRFAQLDTKKLVLTELAGSPITEILTHAPGNSAAFGGLKVISSDGWFALRPSGTEPLCKLYAESYQSEKHLSQIIDQADSVLAAL